MKQLFSSVLKRQKILFLSVLFLSSIIFITPTVGKAADLTNLGTGPLGNGAAQATVPVSTGEIGQNAGAAGVGGTLQNGIDTTTLQNTYGEGGAQGGGNSNYTSCTVYSDQRLYTACRLTEANPDGIKPDDKLSISRSIMLGIPRLLLEGTYELAAYSNFLLTYIIVNIMGSPITTNATFSSSWALVRDLANMVIVLGFVIVGIATSLRIREYEARALLGRLIAIALVVNFSGLFCGLIIDASNLVTNTLANQPSSSTAGANSASVAGQAASGTSGTSATSTITINLTPGSAMLSAMIGSSQKNLNFTLANADIWTFGEKCFLFGTVFLGVAFTLLYLTAIFIARYAILIFLFILSPLAFAVWIFPVTKKMWNEWWDNFLKWAFVGVFGSFVLYVASALVTKIGTATGQLDILSSSAVVLIFLFVGFKMTAQKTGVASMVGGAIMGVAKGAAGFAMGAVAMGAKGGAGALDKLTGGRASSAAQRLSAGTGRMMENLGLRPEGTTAQKAQGQMGEASKRIEGMTEEAKTRMATRTIGTTAQNRVAAIQDKIKSGHLDDLGDVNQQHAAIQYAESYMKSRGVSSNIRSDAEKKNYELAGLNESKVKKLTDQGVPAAEASTRLVQEQLKANIPSMSTGEIGRINSAHVAGASNYEFVRDNFNPRTIEQMKVAPNSSLIAGMKQQATRFQTEMAGNRNNKEVYNKLKKQLDAINRLP